MIKFLILVAWLVIFVIIVIPTYKIHHLIKEYKEQEDDAKVESMQTAQNWFYFLIVLASIGGLGIIYLFLKDTIWEGHYFEWLNLAVRWMHITFGIAWIGASFYFVFLENALNRTKNVRDELAGNLWAVHGGGFYYLEKYKLAPKKIPRDLHWFKYEAYFTWLSGFGLLIIVYYFNASSILLDPEVMEMTASTGVIASIISLIIGWIAYDQICKKLSQNKVIFTLAITALVFFFAWFYCQIFSGRAAYIHFGALLGTLMAANVFFVIIPGQKRMVKAARKGNPPNPEDGKNAFIRSYTNNYFTLPVLFVMISNHFPSTFGNTHQWIVLIAITLGSAGIKHYLNMREKEQLSIWVMPISVLLLLSVAVMTAPAKPKYEDCQENVDFVQIQTIINNRCTQCHSNNPTDAIWKVAPNGVKYDTPEQIYNLRDKIFQRTVVSKNMPFNNNQTQMTQEERDMINCWINQGAPK